MTTPLSSWRSRACPGTPTRTSSSPRRAPCSPGPTSAPSSTRRIRLGRQRVTR